MNLIDEIKYTFSSNHSAVKRIIVINVAVFLLFNILNVSLFLFSVDESVVSLIKGLMLPASFVQFIKQPWSIISYMFLHVNFFHILFNMLWLFYELHE